VRERFGPEDERSLQLRLFSGGDGTSLTAHEPLNNVVRVAYQALAIVLSGAQAVHTISWDEALGLPSEEAVLLALRTQQILAHETGVARTADPLGGSHYVEHLTDEIERRAAELIADVEERGGMLQGVLDGSLELVIADAAYREQLAAESGERVVVGVNRFAEEAGEAGDWRALRVGEDVREHQTARLAQTRAEREAEAVEAALRRLGDEARGQANLMPAILACVEAYASVGEICDRLASVFGRHESSTRV
jgi:methylmalonyl-CoA mutase N-terminal domain/subunit